MKRAWAGVLAVLLGAMCVAGCSKKADVISKEGQTETKATQASTEAETEAETKEASELPEGYMYSYVTGLPITVEQGGQRPVAIMLNNAEAAVPQSGINQASVIYEAPAEGGINRLMAICEMENLSGLEKIGSVRSARTYFVYYAAEFRAMFVHFGQAKFAELHLQTAYCDNLNGLETSGDGVFYRTSDRKSPHNAYTSEAGIQQGIEHMQYNRYYSLYDGFDPYEGTVRFAHGEEVTLDDGMDAQKVIPGYPINEPWFEYDAASGEYLRYQYGGAHVDDAGVQLATKNILILSTPCDHYYDTSYLDFHVQAGGTGYYITNGKAIQITWEKPEEWGVPHYYDASGNEIDLNPGKTWICVVQQALEGDIQILGQE